MSGLIQDVIQGLRLIRRNPFSSLTIVFVLTLGIAANTTMFSAFYAWILRPLDFDDPERLVSLYETQPELGRGISPVSPLNLADWREQQRSFEGLGVFLRHVFVVDAEVDPERIDGVRIEAGLFPLLGVEPVLGRGFLEQEDGPGQPASVALIGDALWQHRFQSDPGVIGRSLRLDGRLHTIVGVMKPGFEFPEWAQVWTPLGLAPEVHDRDDRSLSVVGRLVSGVTIDAANADLEAIAVRLESLNPDTNGGWSARAEPLRETWAPPVIRTALSASLGAAFFVLLIICANVANLVLAQATARLRETALRSALGASRRRLIRQAITECTVLALIAGVLSIPATMLFMSWMLDMAPVDPPYLFAMSVDYRAIIYTLVIALATGIVCGVAPVIRNSGIDLYESLKSGGGGLSGPRKSSRLRAGLVIGELALSTALVIGSMLMVRSFLYQQNIDPGYRQAGLLTLQLFVFDSEPEAGAAGADGQAAATSARDNLRLFERALDRVRGLPEVGTVAVSNRLPSSQGSALVPLETEDRSVEPGKGVTAKWQWVSRDYFAAFDIPVLLGREFTQAETLDGDPLVLVSRALGELLWPGESPVGRRLRSSSSVGDDWLTVIGVVGDVDAGERMVSVSAAGPPRAHLYLPYGSLSNGWSSLRLIVRSDTNPVPLAEGVRAALRAADPGLMVSDVKTMKRLVLEEQWVTRFFGRVLAFYAAVALAIAALGVYGVCADAVSRRTREIAVRSALGARRSDLLRLVMWRGLVQGAIGIGSGLLIGLAITRFGSSMLLGISARDPLVFGGVPLVLGAVTLLATYLPARRAMRLDVSRALRTE